MGVRDASIRGVSDTNRCGGGLLTIEADTRRLAEANSAVEPPTLGGRGVATDCQFEVELAASRIG